MQNNKLFVLLPVCLLGITSLMGCHQNSNTPEGLYLYNGQSKLIGYSFDDSESRVLPTYRYSDYGDVAYVKLDDYANILSKLGIKLKSERIGDNQYILKANNTTCIALDTLNEKITIPRMDLIVSSLFMDNNGVVPDVASSVDIEACAVHSSKKTKYIKNYQVEEYDLKQYGFDLLEVDNTCYVPFQLMSNIIMRDSSNDFVYNGIDFYHLSSVTKVDNIAAYISYNSGNKKFLFDGCLFKQGKTLSNEKYRFVAYNEKIEDKKYRYEIFSLLNDGTGALVYGDSASSKGSVVGTNALFFSWRESSAGIYLKITERNTETGSLITEHGTAKISFEKGYFATEKRSEAVAKYTYGLLGFQYDNLYGLKDVLAKNHGYTDFDSFVKSKNLYNDLLSKDSHKYDAALAKFLMFYVDDGHTNYIGTSIYSRGTGKDAQTLTRENYGTRRNKLLTSYQAYSAKRKLVTSLEDAEGLFMYAQTAVIRFDQFANNNSYISNSYPKETSLSEAAKTNGQALFDLAFTQITANTNIENVVIDLTCNSGGLINLLPYMAAFFTDDPTIYLKSDVAGYEQELHYVVDLNHDGKYGDEGDTYKDKYNFYILTSDFSFSCGTAFPTVAKNSGIKIIGKRSGGGACPIGGYSDGSGSTYTTSMPEQICLNDNGTLTHNDAGVPVDYELNSDSWYDLAKLDVFLKRIQK